MGEGEGKTTDLRVLFIANTTEARIVEPLGRTANYGPCFVQLRLAQMMSSRLRDSQDGKCQVTFADESGVSPITG